MARKKRYVIAYDIVDDINRTKAANTLKDYGVRVQKSVFECTLKEESLKELKEKLNGIINKKEDSVLIIPLCEACYKQTQTMGLCIKKTEEDFQVL